MQSSATCDVLRASLCSGFEGYGHGETTDISDGQSEGRNRSSRQFFVHACRLPRSNFTGL